MTEKTEQKKAPPKEIFVAGPYVGEFGWEVFSWQPMVRRAWLEAERKTDAERCIVVTKHPSQPLYPWAGEVLGLEDLPEHLASSAPLSIRSQPGRTLKLALEGPERQIIRDALDQNDWNRNVTAEILGINRTTLYKKMKRLGLESPAGAAVR